MATALTVVKRGYAYVIQNERGHFFSEGTYDILDSVRTDGDDTLTWISSQPWSNGKVGTTGCSSTAEYQMGVAALGNPAYAAMNVQGFGAGVGLSLIHISEPTRRTPISYAVFCLKK